MKKVICVFLTFVTLSIALTSCEKKSIVKPIAHSEKPKDSLNNGGTTTDTTAGGGNTTTKTIIDKSYIFSSEVIGDWKYVGIVAVNEKGEKSFTKRDSASCKNCYTISFKDKNTFVVRISSDEVLGKYKIDSVQKTMSVEKFDNTNVVYKKTFDKKYIQALQKVYACRVPGNLVLYYENAYLIFEPIIPKNLIGTWQCKEFGEIVADKSTSFRQIQPKSKKNYLIQFAPKGPVFGVSSTNKISWKCMAGSDGLIKLFYPFGTMINELYDGQEYLKAIEKVHSYTVNKKGELILYYQKKKKFLIYKPVQQ